MKKVLIIVGAVLLATLAAFIAAIAAVIDMEEGETEGLMAS